MKRVVGIVGIAALLVESRAMAHKPSDSYLRMGEPRTVATGLMVPIRWDVALRDLDRAVELDADHDGGITWAELRRADPAIRALLTIHLRASMAGVPCQTKIDPPPRVVEHSDGSYAVYTVMLVCPASAARVDLAYSLFFDADPQHRGLLRIAGGAEEMVVFAREAKQHEVVLPSSQAARRSRLLSAIAQGVHHIWTGYDHLLFLVALLLPSVLRRREGRWVPVDKLSAALLDVLSVVTAFTIAHSITLSAAALGVLALPSRLVESAIALSVVLAALNNVFVVMRADRWLAAFALGLLHGFGFSSTLADLGLTRTALMPILFGFNIGVELGQAAVVALFVPLAYVARRTRFYRVGLVGVGSIVITILAGIWLYERATGGVLISR